MLAREPVATGRAFTLPAGEATLGASVFQLAGATDEVHGSVPRLLVRVRDCPVGLGAAVQLACDGVQGTLACHGGQPRNLQALLQALAATNGQRKADAEGNG